MKTKKGRPTSFKKRYIKDLMKFFDVEAMRKEVMEVVTEYDREGKPRKTAEKYKYMPNKMPTIYGFAKSIGVDYTTVYRWAEHGEDEKTFEEKVLKSEVYAEDVELARNLRLFCKAYKNAKAAQQEYLMEIGLAGAAPAAAYIFTAKNVTSMRDKVEQDVTLKQVKPLLDNLKPDGVQHNNSNEEGSSPE